LPDLAIRGAVNGDILITDGKIETVGSEVGAARSEIDARGLYIFPGVVDIHVHFNEPGRTEWEGAATGSRALAAGGGTVFCDMPLNSTPCTVNAAEFARKRAALEAASIADFGLWGGLVPGSVPHLAGMADAGAIGFKAFLCDSGLPEFPRADDTTLYEGMREAARLGVPVGVHAENQELTSKGLRPLIAELEAIQRACLFAKETGAKLHVVHVSSGRGVAIAAESGADVTIETCPHYLCFTEEDVERLGSIAKCAPPLRPSSVRDSLWNEVLHGGVDTIGSDHSPAPPEMKLVEFARAWGGIAGAQSTLPALIDLGLPPDRIAALAAARPAERFGLKSKGRIAPGFDADLVLVDLDATHTLRAEDLFQRHRLSPYTGRTFRGVVRRTIRRGETIYCDGAITATSKGRFLPCTH